MAAKYREIRRYLGKQSRDLSLKQLAELSQMRVRSVVDSQAELSCRLNFWSYGEVIEISIADVNEDLVIEISSRCSVVFQIEDWGKNQKNVRLLFESIERLFNGAVGQIVPACQQCGYRLVGIDVDRCPECGNRTGNESIAASEFRQRLRTGIRWAVGLSIVEIAIGLALQQLGWLPRFGLAFTPIYSVLMPILNVLVILSLLIVARIWRPNR